MNIIGFDVLGPNKPRTLAELENAALAPRSTNVISCWHINDVESSAMWAQYSTRNAGLAVVSTVGQLEEAIDFSEFQNIALGKVNYQPFKTQRGEEFSHNVFFFHKRKSFEHEQEFRVLLSPPRESPKFAEMQQQGGLFVKVDLAKLIAAIYIAPFTPPWFAELIRSIVSQKYGLKIMVFRSKIDDDPSIG